MPIYCFECSKCEHCVERFMKSGEVLETCPECGEKTLEKVVAKNTSFKINGYCEAQGYGDYKGGV